ncbi:MAG: VOC family protein [Acidobacteria bacterium]|nr:VOC family protein [Acidobacteriota bacterium]
MPTPNISPGDPCWIDLMTSDTAKSQQFYGAIFGWTFETGDVDKYGGYIMALKNGQPVAGIMKNEPDSKLPDIWTTYLRVEDINATAEAAAAQGGQVLVPPMEVPEQGHMSLVLDASGATVGLWQFGGHTGFGVHDEAGAPSWHELHTRDFDTAVNFYQSVFDWDVHVMSDTPEFRYSTLGSGEQARAGIMDASAFLPEGVPSNWQVYLEVEDVDTSLAQALSLGASVVHPAEDSEFGRMATITDPTGALVKLRTSPKEWNKEP